MQQDYNQLLPWLTAIKNVEMPVRSFLGNNKEIRKKAEELIQLVDLQEHSNKYPCKLSGGQKQRVALARALILNPDLILMDEPFAALDITTREALQKSTKEVITKMQNTVLFVTHNINESLYMADKMLVLGKEGNYFIDNPKSTSKEELKKLL